MGILRRNQRWEALTDTEVDLSLQKATKTKGQEIQSRKTEGGRERRRRGGRGRWRGGRRR